MPHSWPLQASYAAISPVEFHDLGSKTSSTHQTNGHYGSTLLITLTTQYFNPNKQKKKTYGPLTLIFYYLPIVEVLSVAEGVVPKPLGDGQIVRAHEPSELGPDLVKDVPPSAFALATQGSSLLFVHLKISGKRRPSRQDPRPTRAPPFPQSSPGIVSNGRHWFGSSDPWSGWRWNGLDLEGEGGESSLKALLWWVFWVCLGDGEGLIGDHWREEGFPLNGVDDGGLSGCNSHGEWDGSGCGVVRRKKV